MRNRFYTVLLVPEKTDRVRRWMIPAWTLRAGALLGVFVVLFAIILVTDYWFVLRQIDENKELKLESIRLKQQVQIYRNKTEMMGKSLERIQTFATRLKVITNLEDRDTLLQTLRKPQPDSATNIGTIALDPTAPNSTPARPSPDEQRLKDDALELDQAFQELSDRSLETEQNLQDLYELLVDQREFLAALPTRRPAAGLFTNGFGIRSNPYGGGDRMHEGIDIANHPGTHIFVTANGTVRSTGLRPGHGRTVVVDHGYGLETWYAHASKILVQAGQTIKRGEKIALMGSTGRSTGPHLHYEVRVNGIPVDPMSYILEN